MSVSISPSKPSTKGAPKGDQPLLPTGWPLLAALFGYPVLWALGLASFIWSILLLPVGIHLLRRRQLAAPPGIGMWLVFLALVVLSFVQVESGSSAAVFLYRASIYLASGAFFVYTYNLSLTPAEERRLLLGVAAFWVFLIVGGFAALVMPTAEFPSALELVLPRSLANQEFVRQLIHPVMAQLHDFLGYPVARPAMPFSFTNDWGSNVGLFAPVYLFVVRSLEGWPRRLGLFIAVVALIPIIYSLNRGLWLGLILAAVYVAIRNAIRGHVRLLFATLGTGMLLFLALVTTPLGDMAMQRAETGHSDSARMHLIESSLEAIAESPLIGHGGTVRDPERASRAPAGTHGQLWMVAVSHGVPAAVIFVAFIGTTLLATSKSGPESLAFWCNVMLIVLVSQLFVYTTLPSQLPIALMLLGMALRRTEFRPSSSLAGAG